MEGASFSQPSAVKARQKSLEAAGHVAFWGSPVGSGLHGARGEKSEFKQVPKTPGPNCRDCRFQVLDMETGRK